MRPVRGLRVKALLGLAVLGVAGYVTAATLGSPANHGNQKWSGQWDFVHLGADGIMPTGVAGGFAFRHETDDGGATLLAQIGGTSCPEPTDYFAGGYTVPDDEALPPGGSFADRGKIRACTVEGNPRHVRGRYQSNDFPETRGNIDLTLDASGISWTGTYTLDGTPGTSNWRGTFESHFEDGADDPSIPPYSTAGTVTGGTTTGATTLPLTTPTSGQTSGGNEQTGASAGSRASVATTWARGKLGSDDYAGRCERFVEDAYGAPPGSGYKTALQAASKLRLNHGPITDAPAGALLYFGPKKNCPSATGKYGHAGLSLGNGKMISALGVVKITDLNRSPRWRDAFLGWAKAPARWPGR